MWRTWSNWLRRSPRATRKNRPLTWRPLLETLETRNLLSFSLTSYLDASQLGYFRTEGVAAGDFNNDGYADVAVAAWGPFDRESAILVSLNEGGSFLSWYRINSLPDFSYPYEIAVGDFNGDGNLDIAAACYGTNSVDVLLGNGDGTFKDPVAYPTVNLPFAVTVADVNNDGIPDLLTHGDGDGRTGVLLGNGDGTFQPAIYSNSNTAVGNIAVGDFNGDGNLDMATGNYGGDTVAVQYGNGDGTFGAPVMFSAGNNSAWNVAAGDLNHDGFPDLVVAYGDTNLYGTGNLSVLLNNGDGTFAAPRSIAVTPALSDVKLADVNNDGNLDVIGVTWYGADVTVWEGNGDGTFGPGISSYSGGGAWLASVGDFNNDGLPDLAVVNDAGGAVNILTNNGDFRLQHGSPEVRASSPSSDQIPALAQPSPTTSQSAANLAGLAIQRGGPGTGGVNIGAYQASASAFLLDAPDSVSPGVTFDVTMTAEDPFGQVGMGYTGTVAFSASDPDPGVVLPGDYTFTTDDQGTHTFSGGFPLLTPGDQTLTASDTVDDTIKGIVPVMVTDGGGAPGRPHGAGRVDALFAVLASEGGPRGQPNGALVCWDGWTRTNGFTP